MEYSVIKCRFPNYPTEYSFKTDIDFKVGEKAVVEAAGKVQVATVSRVGMVDMGEATKWAFQKVDEGRLAFIRGREEAMRVASGRIKVLRGRLDRMLRARSADERYAELARSSPEAADALAELKMLEAAEWTE